MLYETLKWPQIAPFCISLKVIMACTLLSLSYVPAIEPKRRIPKEHYNQVAERHMTFRVFSCVSDFAEGGV